jgi:XRE family transcriptional regulator, regulator of sulfur utilization
MADGDFLGEAPMTGDHTAFLAGLGLRVRVLRMARGMAQDRLATVAGISRVTLGSIERGDHAASILTYRALASALEVPLSALFDEDSRLGYLTSLARTEQPD